MGAHRPRPRAVQSICPRAVNDQLFCFGGYDHKVAARHNDVWVYDESVAGEDKVDVIASR